MRSGGLFLGGLAPENGIATLIEALRYYPGARVRVLGPVEPAQLREHMRAASYLVLPGLEDESAPRPLVEAFANELPVIAADSGVLAEIIEPGRNGLLFEHGSARDLARRLAWAEAFPERMRQMGECARADYEARFIADWSYQKLFGERRRAARL